MENNGVSPYNILNISPNCTIDQLRTQFKTLAVKYHPDKGGDANVFNLMVASFKVVHKDLKNKQDQKEFYQLKNDFKEETPLVETDRFVVAKDGFGEKFNKHFNENKTRDENVEKGYEGFINESEVKTSEKHYKLRKYKEPEGSVLSKLQFEELGTKVTDFSGRNDDMHKLQFMDYQYAHTTSKLIEPEMVEKRQEFKSMDDIQTRRKNENFELTNTEKKYYEKIHNMNDKKEQKRISNLEKYHHYLSKHNESVGKLFIQ
jgi:curved DNA-binding protein CbpA